MEQRGAKSAHSRHHVTQSLARPAAGRGGGPVPGDEFGGRQQRDERSVDMPADPGAERADDRPEDGDVAHQPPRAVRRPRQSAYCTASRARQSDGAVNREDGHERNTAGP
jgi:hypothetical protein